MFSVYETNAYYIIRGKKVDPHPRYYFVSLIEEETTQHQYSWVKSLARAKMFVSFADAEKYINENIIHVDCEIDEVFQWEHWSGY